MAPRGRCWPSVPSSATFVPGRGRCSGTLHLPPPQATAKFKTRSGSRGWRRLRSSLTTGRRRNYGAIFCTIQKLISFSFFFFLPRNQSNKHIPLLLKIISSPNSSRNKTLLMYLSGASTSLNKIKKVTRAVRHHPRPRALTQTSRGKAGPAQGRVFLAVLSRRVPRPRSPELAAQGDFGDCPRAL